MAPPESLLQSISAMKKRKEEAENVSEGRDKGGRTAGSSRGKTSHGAENGASSGGNSSNNSSSGGSSGGSSGSSSGGSSSGSSGSSSSSSSGGQGAGGSAPSDSENNVKFLDNVSLMNDLAYELVNGNANAWANIARDRGIINSKQHTEIKYIVATRNCIAHGSGDTVRITAELVKSARDYYELMRRTASQVR